LPHRLAPKLKPKEPRTTPIKTKAITILSENNLSSTIDVQITDEIKKLANETLKGNPVLIYEYIRNNFNYEPYYGSIKGSQQTLWEKAGNDVDLSSLLISLYRASNIPARYVYGTIEIPIERAMNWVGVKDPYTCAQVFASGGIPSKAITSGGKIVAIQLEHCWVEAWVKYTPFEGVEVGAGDTWVPLDPSFKRYEEQEGVDFATELPFNAEAFLEELKDSSTINEEEGYVTGGNRSGHPFQHFDRFRQ
jgi:transglutaminase-like putative cysteine protease